MKFIFDFDEVIFYTTRHRNEHMFLMIENTGISLEKIQEYYRKERENQFSLKKMLAHFSINGNLYEEIMRDNQKFVNKELLEIIKKIGKENCYIVTYGEKDFQNAKIQTSGVSSLFSEIITVPGSKKEVIEKICAKHRDEEVIFVDDKAFHFEGLDYAKYPNLKTILFTNTSQLRDALPGLYPHK